MKQNIFSHNVVPEIMDGIGWVTKRSSVNFQEGSLQCDIGCLWEALQNMALKLYSESCTYPDVFCESSHLVHAFFVF